MPGFVVLCVALQAFKTEASAEITEDDFIDLIYAVRLGDAEGVVAELDKGIPVGQIDGDFRTLMWHAISAEQSEIVELLADRGYDSEQRIDGRLPIEDDFGAALQSNLETLQTFIRGSSEPLNEVAPASGDLEPLGFEFPNPSLRTLHPQGHFHLLPGKAAHSRCKKIFPVGCRPLQLDQGTVSNQ